MRLQAQADLRAPDALIKGLWMDTEPVSKNGRCRRGAFKGFYGKYRVSVRMAGGIEQSFEVHLSQGGAGQASRFSLRVL